MAKTNIIRFRVDKEFKERVVRTAKKKGLTISEMIRRMWLQAI